jgi:chromosome segregation ATPase
MTDDELKGLLDTMRQENSTAHEDTRRRFDAVDASLASVDARFASVDARFDAVDARFDAVDARFAAVDARFAAVDARFTELHRHFDVVTEATKHEVRLVAESVAHVNEELERRTNALRQEMSRGFAETQAMIKFSHVELDRRVNVLEESHHALEETVADLQSRVQRLESGTH